MAYSKEVKRIAEKYLTLYKQLVKNYDDDTDAFKDIVSIIDNDYPKSYTFKCKLQDYMMFKIKTEYLV